MSNQPERSNTANPASQQHALGAAPPAGGRAAARPRLASTGGGANRPRRPVYPTRAPPRATLAYRLRQSNPDGRLLEGPATLEWQADPASYSLRLTLQPADAPARSWISNGVFAVDGVEPRRLVQQDGQRETRRLELGTAAPGAPARLAAGSQDRWSWLAQLAAILEARPRAPPAYIDLAVTGLRGTVEQWRFARKDPALASALLRSDAGPAFAPGQAARLLMWVKEPDRPYDLRIEAWLDPARHHWPAALRLSTPPSRWTFYLHGLDDEHALHGGQEAAGRR
ncbi:MAG TPA: hypothetical protein VH328_04740 [Burkholderiaceae bacterium]|nr:hypothetical protein [Burkholderiaceae bacterium]